jgi:CspA family cold shock protein
MLVASGQIGWFDGSRTEVATTSALVGELPCAGSRDTLLCVQHDRRRGVVIVTRQTHNSWGGHARQADRHSEVVQRRKGVRFHHPSRGGDDLFVHFKSIESDGFKSLKEGQTVSFVAVQGQKGMQADQVRPE